MSARKACTDCKYLNDSYGSSCDNPLLKRWEDVDGWLSTSPAANRKDPDRCGPWANYWEPRMNLWGTFIHWFANN